MIKLTRRSILAFIVSFVLMFISASVSHAQENPEEMAKKLGISFPIAELSNCGNLSACKAFCDNESNKDACLSFAQKKGIKVENRGPKDSKVMQSAQSELGCNSEASCRAVCEQETNRDKCASFAQKHGLGGPKSGNPGDKNVLNKAKEILGCDSEASCKSVCENPANQEKCSNFAKSTGLSGGIKRAGPGGCNSEESCKAFCENNREACRGFGGAPEGHDSGRRGPDGCNSEESCRKICESNPEKCQGLGGGEGPREDRGGSPEESSQRPGDRMPLEGFDKRGPSGSEPYVMPPEGFTNPETGRPDFDPDQQQLREYPTPVFQTPSSESVNYSTPPQEVRGMSTGEGLLQQIFNQLLTLF